MKIKVLLLESDDSVKDELLIEVSPDMRAGGLVDALRREDVIPPNDDSDYRVLVDVPSGRPLGGAKLQEMDTVIVKKRVPSFQILRRKSKGD
jgi:hypothetical protein